MTIKTKAILAATAMAVALPAAAQERVFRDVEVSFDIGDVENEVAANFWNDLEGDIEEAMLAKIVDRTVAKNFEGSEIDIDINEIAMASSFEAAFGADSTLVGDVTVRNPDGTLGDFYRLTVTVDQAGDFLLNEQGLFVNEVEVDRAYAAMIDTFTGGVVERLN